MPESLSIGAFAFGAILVLAALVGGQFKLFGAEVNAQMDRSVRGVAFVLGLLLLGWALFGGHAPSTMGTESAPRTPQAAQAHDGDVAAAPKPQPPPPALPSLAGEWVDNHGGVHQISQDGERLRFSGYNAGAGVESAGTGRIDGSIVTWAYRTDIPSTGTARLRLAPDGDTASGQADDSAEGRYALVLTRAP